MKKIILIFSLLIVTLIVTSCGPINQGIMDTDKIIESFNDDRDIKNFDIDLIYDFINSVINGKKKKKSKSISNEINSFEGEIEYNVGQIVLFNIYEYYINESDLGIEKITNIIGSGYYRVIGASLYFTGEDNLFNKDVFYRSSYNEYENIIFIEGSLDKVHALTNSGSYEYDKSHNLIEKTLEYSSHKTIKEGYVVKVFDDDNPDIFKVIIKESYKKIVYFSIDTTQYQVTESNYINGIFLFTDNGVVEIK